MTPVVECLSCHGIYQPVQQDGMYYYHRCPPLTNSEYQPDPRRPAYDPREVIDRANHRDESVIGGTGPTAHLPRAIGRGVRPLVTPTPKETHNE